MKKNMQYKPWYITLVSISALFVLSAVVHRLQLDLDNPEVYTESVFVITTVGLSILLLFLHAANFFVFIYQLATKKFGAAKLNLAVIILTTILFIAALYIDGPTLIFAT